MSEKKLRSQVIKKRIVKSILWVLLTPLILLTLAIGLIHLPPVQNYIVDEITQYLTEGTGYTTDIEYANIRWFNSVVFDGTVIHDNDSTKMIAIDELVISFKLRSLIGKKDIEINEAWLKGAEVNLRKADSIGLNIDEWVYNITKLTAPENPTPGEPGSFEIDKVTLLDSEFSLSDIRRDSISEGFDYNHFRVQNLNADLLNLKAIRDTFQIDVQYLTTQDQKTGLLIHDLSTFFQISQKGMAFYDLDFQFGKSRIRDSVVFRHNKPSDMGYFVDSVDISANFEQSIVHTDELGLFAPELKELNESVELSGYFKGNVRRFYSNDFALKFSENTKLSGAMELDGLPNIDQTIFVIDLENSSLKTSDFEEYLPKNAFEISDKLGQISLSGNFDGFLSNFVANGDFETEIGDFSSNTLISTGEGVSSYEGGLTLNDFDLGYFTGDSIFQRIDMNGTVKGSGFTLEEADFLLNATISEVGINGYDYNNIVVTDGRLAQSFFNGDLEVDDDNFILKAKGSVDLRDRRNLFNIDGRIQRAKLDSLKLTSADVLLASEFKMDFTGIKLDSINGEIDLQDTYLKYYSQDILMDSLFFSAQRNGSERQVEFESNYFDIRMDGNFEFTSLLDELKSVNEQYRLIFSSQMGEMDAFLANLDDPTTFDLTYNIDLPDITPIIHLFDTAIYVSPNAQITGRFSSDSKEDFVLDAQIDSMRYANINFIGNEIYINAQNLRDSVDVLTQGYLYSKKQVYANTSETESLTAEAVWDGKHVDIRQTIGQESSGNYAEIGANIDFFPDRTELTFEPSILLALDQTWHISEDNIVVFGEKRIDIENLNIYNEDQSVNFEGEVSVLKDSAKTLQIVFEDVGVENINTITNKEYSGKINGRLSAQDLYYNPLIFGELGIDELKVDDFLVGDVDGSLLWNDRNKLFDLKFEVTRNNRNIISLRGDFYPSKRAEQLDLTLKLDDANLNIAEPYIEDYFTQIAGTVQGEIAITGSLRDPVLKGNGMLTDGAMKINYLNTNYNFGGEFNLDKDIINLPLLDVVDKNQSTLSLSGAIRHNSLRNFTFDLNGIMQNFNVLDTDVDHGEVYYGEAYASGTLNLSGEANNLSITSNATTQPNTQIFIPIGESEEIQETSFIKFVDRTDTVSTVAIEEKDEVKKVQIDGLNLDLDINVTPDAYTEIIIDAQTGDIIRGRGNGQLRLQIDTQGDFQMTGDLEITEGAYNFSLYNIITKEFNIEQPSRISWFGDPYAGVMDINASYSQSTSLAPLLSDIGIGNVSEGGNATTGRRFPTKVLLKLQGELLSPQINFDIDFSEINTQDFQFQTAINAFKNKVANDEQELNRQVLSLIVLNRFSEQGNLNIGGQTATQNVSQLLSNQLSQLIAQLDENLEVDFDLTDLSPEALNTFQLRLSYTFLNGRLRITREGGISNLVDVNSIAGDWTAEYLLTQDGRYKVKVYSRTNFDLLRQAGQPIRNNNSTTGASITQTTSFNNLREFFSGIGKKRRNKQKRASKPNDSGSGSN